MDETRRLIERARQTAEEARRVTAETRRLVKASREIQHWTARVQGRAATAAGSSFSFNRFSNSLLAMLPTSELNRLVPALHGVAFTPKQVLHRPNAAIEHVYFPVSGLLTAALVMQDGGIIGVSTIGNDGIAGLAAVVGTHVSPYELSVQIPGYGLRIDVDTLRAEFMRGGLLRDVLGEYQNACAVQNAYQIACNSLHNARERCSRHLLSIQDRIASEVLPLTHESLALTLGVRRATVSEELAALHAHGAIDTQRGRIRIIDRPKLQSLACECYEAVRLEFDRLFHVAGIDNSPSLRLSD